MARIKTSAIIDDIRGSVGNMVFDNWKGVGVLRRKSTSRVNPHSLFQSNMRARITSVSKRWHLLLSQAQRDAWNEFASQWNDDNDTKSGSSGNIHETIPESKGPQTGYSAFLRLNALGLSAGVFTQTEFILDPPLGVPAPGMPTGIDVGFSGGTCQIIVEWTGPEAAVFGTRIRIWIHSFDAGVHLQIGNTEAIPATSTNIASVRIAHGKQSNVWLHPGLYHTQLDAIGPDGQKGPSSQINSIIVPVGCTP